MSDKKLTTKQRLHVRYMATMLGLSDVKMNGIHQITTCVVYKDYNFYNYYTYDSFREMYKNILTIARSTDITNNGDIILRLMYSINDMAGLVNADRTYTDGLITMKRIGNMYVINDGYTSIYYSDKPLIDGVTDFDRITYIQDNTIKIFTDNGIYKYINNTLLSYPKYSRLLVKVTTCLMTSLSYTSKEDRIVKLLDTHFSSDTECDE